MRVVVRNVAEEWSIAMRGDKVFGGLSDRVLAFATL